jgi:hypothetical protein
MNARMQMRTLTVAVVFFLSLSGAAFAQTQVVNFKLNFELLVDCDQPTQIRNTPVHGDGSGHIGADRSAVADLRISALTTNTVHFQSHLGGGPQPAPGGNTIINVLGQNRIRMVWELPTNQLIATVSIKGKTCSTQLDTKLRFGNRQYSLFDGAAFYFCNKPRVVSTSCEVN